MLISRHFVAQCLRLRGELRALCHSRLLHRSSKGAGGFKRFRFSRPPPSQRPSLLEELFPEEVHKDGDKYPKCQDDVQNVPRLPLPEIDDISEGFDYDFDRERAQPKSVANKPAATAFRQQQLAVLSLDTSSKSLIESDFRRIAPKGQHIDDWTGPGDILKIIPMRDPTTLEPVGRYLILFPNPAYARTYQKHVIRLHQIAKTHTPTSIESPLPLQPGVVIEGEDAYTLLQDYSLCPPAQRIPLRLLFPSYSAVIKQVLDRPGYRQLLEEANKTSRCVLFWVDGQQLHTSVIQHTIAADGRERGLAWDVSIDRLDTSIAAADGAEDSTSIELDELARKGARRHAPSRWIMAFSNENEARRFIRAWHRRPFPSARGDDLSPVQAEFIW